MQQVAKKEKIGKEYYWRKGCHETLKILIAFNLIIRKEDYELDELERLVPLLEERIRNLSQANMQLIIHNSHLARQNNALFADIQKCMVQISNMWNQIQYLAAYQQQQQQQQPSGNWTNFFNFRDKFKMNIQDLNEDCLVKIFTKLEFKDLMRAELTCITWKEIIDKQ